MKNTINDSNIESKKMTTTINVMTIITFIGCIYSLITAISFLNPQLTLEMLLEPIQKSIESAEDYEILINVFLKQMDNTRILFENKYLFSITEIIFSACCVYGAVEMRKMNKIGFYAYTTGQIIPLLASLAITGWNIASGTTFIFSVLFSGIFILIYAFQLKHMR